MVKKIKYLPGTCDHKIKWNIYFAYAMPLPFPSSVSSALVFTNVRHFWKRFTFTAQRKLKVDWVINQGIFVPLFFWKNETSPFFLTPLINQKKTPLKSYSLTTFNAVFISGILLLSSCHRFSSSLIHLILLWLGVSEGVGGGIFWESGSGGTFFRVGWGWAKMVGGIIWVGGSECTFFMGG